MKFEDIIEGQFYKITETAAFVFWDEDGRETLGRFLAGAEVRVQAKISTPYASDRHPKPWNVCLCEVECAVFDDTGNALLGAHVLEPLHSKMGRIR